MLYFAYGSNMDENRLKERMTSDNSKYGVIPRGKYSILYGERKEGYKLVFNKKGADGL
ncbi:MAG: hypothetical protein ABI430_02575 [Candidatus Taylorbacteria bacterium]